MNSNFESLSDVTRSSSALFLVATLTAGCAGLALTSAILSRDPTALSQQLRKAFYPPRFKTPELIQPSDVVPSMDRGQYMFVVAIPPRFEQNVRSGREA